MQTPPALTQIFRRRRLLAGGGLLAALTAGVALYWWIWADLPPVHSALLRAASPTTQILDRNGQLLYEWIDPAAGKQLDLELSRIPAACIQATIATEDSRFFWHGGVDPLAILRALWQNLQSQGIVSGASTLTQQLARNLLMENQERFESSLRRKLREAVLAWQLEQTYTKDALLALYLNQTYYGNFAFGIEAAAQIFFAKPASQLSLAECALLAGLVQYPSGYNPLLDPEAAKGRQLTVLRLMQSHGALTAAQAEEAARQPLQYRSSLFAIEAPHFVMYVQELLVQQLGLERVRAGGLRVYTTLDLDLQRQAETALRRRLAQLTCQAETACTDPAARSRQVDSAAAVILDSQNGDILTLIGSPDYFAANASGNVNAALARRQPGSAIKPFTYAAALDPQWSSSPPLTAATILPDLPKTFTVQNSDGSQAPYRPQNYDRKAHGPVSLRTALANSYNVPAVEVLEHIGVETLRQLAAQAGIATFTERYGLALTLGGGEVRLLDLTAAYSIFDDGYALAPRALQRVESSAPATSQATTIFHLAPPTTSPQVLSPQAAYLITDILADDLARAPTFGRGSVLDLPFPAAVKTGTTTDWRDNWTVGYSTQRIVGVWVGNADNT
ncbi:MAG: transglycosylase domain-containing protein, partial [Caldilinea sp.]